MALFYGKRHEKVTTTTSREVTTVAEEVCRTWIYRDLRSNAIRYPHITVNTPSIPSIPIVVNTFNDKDYVEIDELSLNVDTRGRISVTFFMSGTFIDTNTGAYNQNQEELSTIVLDTAANPKIPVPDGSNLTSCFPISEKIIIKNLGNHRNLRALFIGFRLSSVVPIYGTICSHNVRYVKHT